MSDDIRVNSKRYTKFILIPGIILAVAVFAAPDNNVPKTPDVENAIIASNFDIEAPGSGTLDTSEIIHIKSLSSQRLVSIHTFNVIENGCAEGSTRAAIVEGENQAGDTVIATACEGEVDYIKTRVLRPE